MESCEVCGFVWETVADAEIVPRIEAGTDAVARLLLEHPTDATRRPDDSTWSMVEYASHLRDVLLHVRDRVVIGLVEDDPTFKPLYRDERVDLGLYAAERPAIVADELAMAAALFNRTYGALSDEQLARPCQYTFPVPATRSLRWMAQQVVHEVEHHRADAENDLAQLRH